MRKIIFCVLYILIGINFIYVLSGVLNYPIVSIDTLSIWLLKAKEFYLNGILPLSQLNQYPYSHPQYPILLPLIFTYIYRVAGFNELYVLLFYPFIYLFIIYFAYKIFLLLNFEKVYALVLSYIYSMLSPLLAAGGRGHAGEADIFIVLIYWLIIYLVIKYEKLKINKYLISIVFLIGLGSLIKQEGVLGVSFLLYIPVRARKKALLIIFSLIPFIVWQIISRYSGLTADFGFKLPGFYDLMGRLVTIPGYMLRELINFRNWYFFWPLFFLVFFIKDKAGKTFNYLIKVLAVFFAGFFVNYLFSSLNAKDYVPSSFDRVLLQISPLFFTIFALRLKFVFKEVDIINKLHLKN